MWLAGLEEKDLLLAPPRKRRARRRLLIDIEDDILPLARRMGLLPGIEDDGTTSEGWKRIGDALYRGYHGLFMTTCLRAGEGFVLGKGYDALPHTSHEEVNYLVRCLCFLTATKDILAHLSLPLSLIHI